MLTGTWYYPEGKEVRSNLGSLWKCVNGSWERVGDEGTTTGELFGTTIGNLSDRALKTDVVARRCEETQGKRRPVFPGADHLRDVTSSNAM
ncbi:hypothetical protein SMC26_19220 [Actinomadura fulvescens]|uniref:Uncharacterized protein n=1 Tax=Actinomadura fulvescens TaxID=46160 RepID=A0ABN3QGC1_9ACTN